MKGLWAEFWENLKWHVRPRTPGVPATQLELDCAKREAEIRLERYAAERAQRLKLYLSKIQVVDDRKGSGVTELAEFRSSYNKAVGQ